MYNTQEMNNLEGSKFLPHLPTLEFYDVDNMNIEKREQFLIWYENNNMEQLFVLFYFFFFFLVFSVNFYQVRYRFCQFLSIFHLLHYSFFFFRIRSKVHTKWSLPILNWGQPLQIWNKAFNMLSEPYFNQLILNKHGFRILL